MFAKFLFAYSLLELVGIGMLLMLEFLRAVLLVGIPTLLVDSYDQEKLNATTEIAFIDLLDVEVLVLTTTPDPRLEEIREELITSAENESVLFLFSIIEVLLMLLATFCMLYATKNGNERRVLKQRYLLGLSNFFAGAFLIVIYFRIGTMSQLGPEYKFNNMDLTIILSKIMIFCVSAMYSHYLGQISREGMNDQKVEKV